MYISMLPIGLTIEDIYKSLQGNKLWSLPQWSGDIKLELAKESNRDYKDLLETIQRINVDSDNQSTDQYLFEVMDKKYKLSEEITTIIQESSIDCIPHTRDNIELNENCIRFSDKLQSELAYFPGLGIESLEQIDSIQLISKVLVAQKPDIYIVSATENNTQLFVYYQLSKNRF